MTRDELFDKVLELLKGPESGYLDYLQGLVESDDYYSLEELKELAKSDPWKIARWLIDEEIIDERYFITDSDPIEKWKNKHPGKMTFKEWLKENYNLDIITYSEKPEGYKRRITSSYDYYLYPEKYEEKDNITDSKEKNMKDEIASWMSKNPTIINGYNVRFDDLYEKEASYYIANVEDDNLEGSIYYDCKNFDEQDDVEFDTVDDYYGRLSTIVSEILQSGINKIKRSYALFDNRGNDIPVSREEFKTNMKMDESTLEKIEKETLSHLVDEIKDILNDNFDKYYPHEPDYDLYDSKQKIKDDEFKKFSKPFGKYELSFFDIDVDEVDYEIKDNETNEDLACITVKFDNIDEDYFETDRDDDGELYISGVKPSISNIIKVTYDDETVRPWKEVSMEELSKRQNIDLPVLKQITDFVKDKAIDDLLEYLNEDERYKWYFPDPERPERERYEDSKPKDSKIGDIIKETDKGYIIYSEKGKRLSKPYKTRKEAEERLKEIEMFKHIKDAVEKPELLGKKIKITVNNALSNTIDRMYGKDIISREVKDKNVIEYVLPYDSRFDYFNRRFHKKYTTDSNYRIVKQRDHYLIYQGAKLIGSADSEIEAEKEIEKLEKEEKTHRWELWYTNSLDENCSIIVKANTELEALKKAKYEVGAERQGNFRDITMLDSKEDDDLLDEDIELEPIVPDYYQVRWATKNGWFEHKEFKTREEAERYREHLLKKFGREDGVYLREKYLKDKEDSNELMDLVVQVKEILKRALAKKGYESFEEAKINLKHEKENEEDRIILSGDADWKNSKFEEDVINDIDEVIMKAYPDTEFNWFNNAAGGVWHLKRNNINDSEQNEKTYIYQFPSDLNKQDLKLLPKYNLKLIGKVEIGNYDGRDIYDFAVEGTKEDLERYSVEHLDYVINPEFLHLSEDFDLDVIK